MSKITLIVAADYDNLIGYDGGLVYTHQKTDMQHFVAVTTGHTVVMGSTTYKTIGHPLKNRENIVLSKDVNNPVFQGCKVITSIDEILKDESNKEYMIIGGASVYEQFLPYASRILLTRIHVSQNYSKYYDNNPKFFPHIKLEDGWKIVDARTYDADADNDIEYAFVEYRRDKSHLKEV